VPSQIAVTTALAATLPICIIGSFGHYRQGHIDLKLGLIFIVVGIAGSVLGAGLTNLMTSDQLKTGFGCVAILLALQIWVCLGFLCRMCKLKKIEFTFFSGDVLFSF
jgi:hypothetical protein